MSLFNWACRACYRRLVLGKSRIIFPRLNQVLYVSSQSVARRPINRGQEQRPRWMVATGCIVFMFGVSWICVPLYKIFCQKTGFGGNVSAKAEFDKIEKMNKVEKRLIKVVFNADVHASLRWKFKPEQDELWVHPGETALAFYSATNPTSKPIVGVSTYNIVPFDAALYFCKIQCFCFEEQILNPGETVDMPVFFYIDPDFVDDSRLEYANEIMLSYTFFESRDGLKLPDAWGGQRTIRSAK